MRLQGRRGQPRIRRRLPTFPLQQGRFGGGRDDGIRIGGELVGEDLLPAITDLLGFVRQEVGPRYGGDDGDSLSSVGE